MILDFKAKGLTRAVAGMYDILDATTGENLNHLRIFYADDERGIIRCHVVDGNGRELETVEHQRPIRIQLKATERETGSNAMDRRIKTLDVPVQTILALARGLGLPADASIAGAIGHPHYMVGNPRITDVRVAIKSQSFPDVPMEALPCHLGTVGSVAAPGGPAALTLTLTGDQLRELAYDADRQPGRRVAIEVQADGAWKAKGAY